jgi:hypothetical protein
MDADIHRSSQGDRSWPTASNVEGYPIVNVPDLAALKGVRVEASNGAVFETIAL